MTRSLRFRMAGRLLFGPGTLAELPEAIRSLGGAAVLLVSDGGLRKAGLIDIVRQVIEGAGLTCAVFDGVEPDPRIEVAVACGEAAERSGCGVIVGLGGGSSLDIAKVAAVLRTNPGGVEPLIGIGNVPHPGLPTVMIPTTAGTGSEVTPIAVLSDKAEQLKKGIVSDHLYPDVALVDPELMLGLPASVTAYTGMDALTHAIEAYTNRFAQPFIDNFATAGIDLIGRALRRAVSNGDDVEARTDMAMGSLYGGLCLGAVNTAACHALAYPLGGTFDVPHGVANSLLLPHVMRFNLVADLPKYAHIAELLGEKVEAMALRDAAERSVAAVGRLADDVGIVARLRDLDIPEGAIDDMAEAAMKVTRLLNNNPRRMAVGDARAIYRAAW